MSEHPISPNPFSGRAALALLVGGGVLLLSLLWLLGSGIGDSALNNGGAHAGARGLTGYAGLARLTAAAGYEVNLARDDTALGAPGLLVLTPPQQASGKDIAHIVDRHRAIGPVAVITPKWQAQAVGGDRPGAKPGWVDIAGVSPPAWGGFRDDLAVKLAPESGNTATWVGPGVAPGIGSGHLAAPLPVTRAVLSGEVAHGQARLTPLVLGQDGRILAARVDDPTAPAGQAALYLVFEPDLLDNFGLAHSENAALAEALIGTMAGQAAAGGGPRHISFDLTLNGLARRANLLTLAFSPPYLAATLCLVLAALVVLWRGSLRFGVPLAEGRAIAFGKWAMVANAAGLIRNARRLHLLPTAYRTATRERLARALGLPRLADPVATEAAIDRALANRIGASDAPDAPNYPEAVATLLAARREAAIVSAAAQLHALERMLTR